MPFSPSLILHFKFGVYPLASLFNSQSLKGDESSLEHIPRALHLHLAVQLHVVDSSKTNLYSDWSKREWITGSLYSKNRPIL